MTTKRKTNSLSNAVAFAQMCLLLNTGAYTKDQLAETTGLTIGTVTRWMRLLEKRELVYVIKWWRAGTVGQWAAKWTWGYRVESAPKPKAQTQSQYNQNSRIRKKMRKSKAVSTTTELKVVTT